MASHCVSAVLLRVPSRTFRKVAPHSRQRAVLVRLRKSHCAGTKLRARAQPGRNARVIVPARSRFCSLTWQLQSQCDQPPDESRCQQHNGEFKQRAPHVNSSDSPATAGNLWVSLGVIKRPTRALIVTRIERMRGHCSLSVLHPSVHACFEAAAVEPGQRARHLTRKERVVPRSHQQLWNTPDIFLRGHPTQTVEACQVHRP